MSDSSVQSVDTSKKKHSSTQIIATTVIVVALIAFIGLYETRKSSTSSSVANRAPQNPPAASNQNNEQRTEDRTPMALMYKDGTYSAIGNYASPGGAEQLGVTLTLKSDVITDVTVEPKAQNGISQRLQGVFAANYKQYVVGKNINEVKLDKVSGSSLTPKGFNDALVQIKSQAKG